MVRYGIIIGKIADLIRQSHQSRKKAEELLEEAKKFGIQYLKMEIF